MSSTFAEALAKAKGKDRLKKQTAAKDDSAEKPPTPGEFADKLKYRQRYR